MDHGLLPPGKVGVKAQLAPGEQVHAGRVERGRHPDAGAFGGPFFQEFEPRLAQVLVADARHLNAGDRHQVAGAVDAAQGNHDLHGPLNAAPALPRQQGLLLRRQPQAVAHSPSSR